MHKDGGAKGLRGALASQNFHISHFLKVFNPFETLNVLLVSECAVFGYSDPDIYDLLGR